MKFSLPTKKKELRKGAAQQHVSNLVSYERGKDCNNSGNPALEERFEGEETKFIPQGICIGVRANITTQKAERQRVMY